MDRIEWLRQQIAARRQAAMEATLGPWEFEGDDPTDDEVSAFPAADDGVFGMPVAFTRGRQVPNGQHIALNDPRDTIARCEAELAILGTHDGACCVKDAYCGEIAEVYDSVTDPCPTVRALASAYRHHAGYEDHWGTAPPK